MVSVESMLLVRLNVLHPPTPTASAETCCGDTGWRSKSSPSGAHLAMDVMMLADARVDDDADVAREIVSSSAAAANGGWQFRSAPRDNQGRGRRGMVDRLVGRAIRPVQLKVFMLQGMFDKQPDRKPLASVLPNERARSQKEYIT